MKTLEEYKTELGKLKEWVELDKTRIREKSGLMFNIHMDRLITKWKLEIKRLEELIKVMEKTKVL